MRNANQPLQIKSPVLKTVQNRGPKRRNFTNKTCVRGHSQEISRSRWGARSFWRTLMKDWNSQCICPTRLPAGGTCEISPSDSGPIVCRFKFCLFPEYKTCIFKEKNLTFCVQKRYFSAQCAFYSKWLTSWAPVWFWGPNCTICQLEALNFDSFRIKKQNQYFLPVRVSYSQEKLHTFQEQLSVQEHTSRNLKIWELGLQNEP